MFRRAVCPWCIWCYSSMFEPRVFCEVCKILTVEWRSAVSTQFVGDSEVRHDLVHCRNDIQCWYWCVTISTAGKWEYRHRFTSAYSLLGSGPKRSALRCSLGLFASSVILNGSCCLVLVAVWQRRHSSTTMVSFLSMPGDQMRPLAYCFVFTKSRCPSCTIRTVFGWSVEGIRTVFPLSMMSSDVWVLWRCACMVPGLVGLA